MLGMPIKASECDSFYEDCKDDLFCVNDASKSFFDLPTCDHDTQCKKFKDIYADGKRRERESAERESPRWIARTDSV